MDQVETNPFNQSPENQNVGFEALRKNPNHVNKVAKWYVRNYYRMRGEGADRRDFRWGPVADNLDFPGKLFHNTLEILIDSESRAQKIVTMINENPSLCIDPPKVPHSIPPIERMGQFDDDFALLFEKLVPKKSHEEIEAERQATKEKNAPAAERLRQLLGLSESEADYDDLSEISSIMQKAGEQLDDALYFRFLLDQAADSIKKIAPSLGDQVDYAVDNTLLVRTGLSDLDSQIDLAITKVGSLHGICVQKDPYTSYFDRNHGFRVMGMGHELFHAVVNDMLEIPSHLPGFRERLEGERLSIDEQERYNAQYAASLGRTISEGVSIAFEYELVKATQAQTNDRSLLGRFEEFAQKRLKTVRKTNRFLSPEYRQRHLNNKDDQFNPSAYPQFAYSEGVKLAIALKRNGWSLNDLPDLLSQIKHVMEKEVGSDDGEKFLQIGVSTDSDSEYQRVVSEIRQLRKY